MEGQRLIKEKEPAPSAIGTSSKNVLHIDDSTKSEICQEALLKIGDRIVETSDEADYYILGYVHAVLDVLKRLGGGESDT